MRIKFLATAIAPESYTIDGSVINGIDVEGEFDPGEARQQGIREVFVEDEQLHVVLCQAPPVTKTVTLSDDRVIESRGGDWVESDWIDANEYDPETLYIREVERGEQPHIVSVE